MRKVDEKVLQALCNLDGNTDFRVIREWFLESASDQDTVLRSAESSVLVYRAQGAVKELLDFCEMTTNPKEKAGKLRMEKAGVFVIP